MLVLVLIAGVLGMHSLASMGMSEMAMPAMAMPSVSSPGAAGPAELAGIHHEVSTTRPMTAAVGVGAQGHGAMHECLAVLTTILLLAALVLAVAVATSAWATVGPAGVRWRWDRAPPWTVLSLAKLSVLRV